MECLKTEMECLKTEMECLKTEIECLKTEIQCLKTEMECLTAESKFISVLTGPLRSVIGLTDEEISQLADYFRTQDGRVLYHQLCQIIHGEEQTANVDAAVNAPVVVDSNDDGTIAQELELEKMRSTLEEAIVETRSTPLENRPGLPRITLSKRNRAVARALNPMLVTYLEASRDLCETDSILFGAALAVCRIIGAKLSTAGRTTGQSSAIPAWTNVSLSQPDIMQKLTERIDDLKQRIAAWGKRIRRYTEKSTRFNQNRPFQSDQKRLYKSLERPMVAKNDGRITFAHFARILNFVGILLSPEDFNLLVRRFIKDSYTIDYVEFLKALEAVKKEGIQGLGPAYLNPKAVIDTTPPKLSRPEIEAGLPSTLLGVEVFHPALRQPKPTRGLVDIMLRVQQFVMQRRIRVFEFFRDFDPLNSGCIRPQQFRRALDMMGFNAILSDTEAMCIIRHYTDPNDKERVCWRTFEDDCDQVFTIKELEKHPDVQPGAVAAVVSELPAPGSAVESNQLTDQQQELAEAALSRIRAACKERAIDLRSIFGDHDAHKNGHVAQTWVRSALSRVDVLPPPQQVRALEMRYLDRDGFNYHALLRDLEEQRAGGPNVVGPVPRSRATYRSSLHETDIVQILAKIKGKMVREGIRPRDFLQQFDKQNELVISRADFYRGLASAGLSLTPVEMETLMEVFSAPGRRRFVEYDRLCATVGEALTQGGLERAPLLQPLAHVPPPTNTTFLNFEERSVVSKAIDKLAKHHDQVSNILEVFKVRLRV
ncbi:unnamed protein product [Parnassius apollo]|uniref:(apollo) hypothetical protein n=1 Tax=Parnassius apollo TaxID=110799 RepID=A0A8S3XP34_PARAO|nr:unnamed protein product [Parnassius apollo]